MSAARQTGVRDVRKAARKTGERRVADFLLYGIDEGGRTGHSETLRGFERSSLRALAEERLQRWHAVEVWEGPMCVVRLRRELSAEVGSSGEVKPSGIEPPPEPLSGLIRK